MNRRILIVGASQGFGHMRAALNLATALDRSNVGTSEIIDYVDYLPRFAKFLLKNCWRYFSLRWPKYYERMYRRFFTVQSKSTILAFLAKRAADRIVGEYGVPDIFIATHSFAIPLGEVLKTRFKSKLYIVATDYVFHSGHATSEADRIYLPPECKVILDRKMVEATKNLFQYTGIPIDPAFAAYKNIRALKETLAIKTGLKTVLISFGGESLKANQNVNLIKKLTDSNLPLQYIILTGRDRRFALSMQKLHDSNDRIKVVPFQENVSEFYAVADLFVGKAGGLSISEALAMKLPMFFVDKMPGQEEFNIRLMSRMKVGEFSATSGELISKIGLYLAGKNHSAASNRFTKIARPQSTRSIVKSISKSA